MEPRRQPGAGASATTGTSWRAGARRQPGRAGQGGEGSGRARRRPTTCATRQLRLIDTLKNDRARRDAARAQDDALAPRRPDPRAGAGLPRRRRRRSSTARCRPTAAGCWWSPRAKGADEGQAGKMPKYVTESGYEEFEDVRTRVGRNAPLPHKLWLVDVRRRQGQRTEVRRAARHRRRPAGRDAQGRQAGPAEGQPRRAGADRRRQRRRPGRSTGATTAAMSR